MTATLKNLEFDVIKLTDAGQREMEAAIREFGSRLKRGGVGLFYFAGHGVQVNGRNYLVPIGAQIEEEVDVKYEAVDAGRVLDEMYVAENGLNIVLLDACRDNPFARSWRRSGQRGLARMDSPVGTLIAYATSPGRTAEDGRERNGTFTKHLLRHMVQPDFKIEDVMKQVRIDVASETGRKQIPWEHSSLMGDFYFASTFQEEEEEEGAGSLRIESIPSGADVRIDGGYYGKTPQEPKDLSAGKVRVRVSMSGYQTEEKVVDIEAGRRKKVSFVLDAVARTGRLFVNPEPSDARVRVTNIGPAYQRGMELEAGRYQLEVSKEGYETEERWVTVSAGSDEEVSVKLRRKVVAGPREIDRDGRFIAYDDGTVLDTESGLMWAAKDNGGNITWQDAKKYCENYRGGGYNDWRMPTQDELAGIYDENKKNKNGYYVTKLIEITACCPWASEIKSDGSSAARFAFDFGHRYWVHPSNSTGYRALPVRRGK